VAKLYYGGGSTTIEGSDIRGVEIRYRGAIEIEDKTSDSFAVAHQNNGIMIFPIGEGVLNDLFDYTGELKILSVIVADIDGEKVSTTIHRVMDYTELLNTNSEDMTTKSEDLSSTYTHGEKVSKTSLKQQYIENLNTSTHDGELFLEDGTLYNGKFKVSLIDNAAITEAGDLLYFKDGKPTRNTGVPYGVVEQQKQRKIQAILCRFRAIFTSYWCLESSIRFFGIIKS